MNGELWGVGRTFLLAVLGIVGAVILIALGKIPEILTLGDWSTFIGVVLGFFAAKSVGHAIANKKNGG